MPANDFEKKHTSATAFDSVESRKGNSIPEDIIAQIKFSDITVLIDRLIIYDKQQVSTIGDSIVISAELGETIEGQTISVLSQTISDLKIEQRYETSVSISAEGPHCDLLDWKHSYSSWKPLEQTSKNQFISSFYNLSDAEIFPDVSINEFKNAVRKHCGENWYKEIKNINSIKESPSSVGISRIYLKVTGKRKDNKLIKKTITIEMPMGC